MRSLIQLTCVDPTNLIYALPPGEVELVFDGHVALEGAAVKIDAIGHRVQLTGPAPAFDLQALIKTDPQER